jgi:hypothetical protein
MKNERFNHEWMKHALDENIERVVIDSSMIDALKRNVIEFRGNFMPESLGYFRGAMKDDKYFIFDRAYCGGYDGNSVKIPDEITYDKYLERILAETIPNYSTVIYHSHPRITQEILRKFNPNQAEEIIDIAKKDINQGIYDYFIDEGRDININEALTEMLGRELSDDDLENTPGRYHLLFTDTLSKNNPFSYFNFYDIKKNNKKKVLIPVDKSEKDYLEKLKSLERKEVLSKMERFIRNCYNCNTQEELEQKAKEEGFMGHILPFYFGSEMRERGVNL